MTAGSIAVPTVMPLRLPTAGRTKNSIDSNTLIEIRSETPGTKIFYTVDNTRPEPDKKLGENTTLLYRDPFMLREGKRYVKALARTKDGRESNVVTKVFNVEYAEPNTTSDSESSGEDDANRFQREMRRDSEFGFVKKRDFSSNEIGGQFRIERFLSKPLINGYKTPVYRKLLKPVINGYKVDPVIQIPVKQHNYVISKRQCRNESLPCVYCSAPRPRNSTSRFCSDCGKPVPIDPTTSSVEPGSMGMCIKCRSYVPLNQTKCIVCEEPFGALPKPIVSVRVQVGMRSCVVHAGPTILPDLTHCTFHAVNTGSAPIHSGDTAPPLPRLDGQLVRCPTCTRVNNPDARYCDWCGAKPIPEQTPMTCSLCKSNNQPYSKFCAQCGSTFTPPNRMDPRNEDLGDQAINFPFQTLPMWTSVPPRVREVDTQTVGLFYPGGKKVNQEQEMMREMRMQEIKMRDKQPPLTAVSPGRGFWRKQLDHICGHLRSYTNNNVEFRSVIGEPRLGKILGTSIEEGEEEMIVSLKFALRGHNEFGDGGNHGLQRDLYQSKKKVAFGSTFDQ
uniref:DZANK-type domain-containing protein n=1 Tax=Ciona savignyi TaxID=51511 RepID=H2YJ20_CIOSA